MDVYLSADEAANNLGISKPTLYAYVSRGLIRSLEGQDSRSRLYNRLDVDQLKARKRIRSRPQTELQGTSEILPVIFCNFPLSAQPQLLSRANSWRY